MSSSIYAITGMPFNSSRVCVTVYFRWKLCPIDTFFVSELPYAFYETCMVCVRKYKFLYNVLNA